MSYRNRKLLDKAREMPCMAKFAHQCSQYDGVEPAHSDQLKHGRGVGHKTDDCWFAAMCHNAHMSLDTLPREVKNAEWDRAYIATVEYMWSNGLVKVA